MYITTYPEIFIIFAKLLHQEEEVIQADIILRGNVAAMPWRVAIRHYIMLPLVLRLTTVPYCHLESHAHQPELGRYIPLYSQICFIFLY